MRERRESSAGPRQVLWCTIIRNFGWNQTGFEIPVFRNPGNAAIAHVQIYWNKVKWCIYIAPFPCNMLKGALQWSVYPQRTGSIYRRLWQPLQIGPCMLVLILPTPGGWKAEWTLAGKKVTQIFNPRLTAGIIASPRENRFAEVTFHVTKISFVAMRRRRMLDRINGGGQQRSLTSLSFSRRLRDLC